MAKYRNKNTGSGGPDKAGTIATWEVEEGGWKAASKNPGASDDVWLRGEREIEIGAGGISWRSLDMESEEGVFKGKITMVGEINIGTTTSPTGNVALRISNSVINGGTIKLKGNANVLEKIYLGTGNTFNVTMVTTGNLGKYQLQTDANINATFLSNRGLLDINGHHLTCTSLKLEGESTNVIALEDSAGGGTITVTGVGGTNKTVGFTGGSAMTIKLANATLEVTDSTATEKKIEVSNELATHELPKLVITGDNVVITSGGKTDWTTSWASIALNTKGNAHATKVASLATGALTDNGTEGAKVKLEGNGAVAKIVLNSNSEQKLTGIEVVKITGEDASGKTGVFQADTASVKGSEVTGIKFATLVGLAAAASTSAGSTFGITVPRPVALAAAASTSGASAQVRGTPELALSAASSSAASVLATAATRVPLGGAASTSTATIQVSSGSAQLFLNAAVSTSAASAAVHAAARLALSAAASNSTASARLYAPTVLPLGTGSSTSAASATVSHPELVPLGAAKSTSEASLALYTPQFVELQSAASSSATGNLAIGTTPQLHLNTAASTSAAGAIRVTITPTVNLNPAASTSQAPLLPISTAHVIPLQPAVSTSKAAELRVSYRATGHVKTAVTAANPVETALQPVP